MKYILSTILVILLFISDLPSQEALSLAQAIEKGLENNFQIQIANKNIEIAKNNNNWGTAGRYPTIDLNASWSNSFTNQNNPSPAAFISKQNIFSSGLTPGISGSLVLFDGHRVQLTKEQLEQLEIQSTQNARTNIENSIRSIILAYYQAQIQLEQIEVLQEVINLSRDRIREQKIRMEFGQAGSFDVLQSTDAFLNDSTTYLIQVNTYENAIRNLNLAMGEDDFSKKYELTDQLVYDAPTYELEDLLEKMYTNNNNLQNLFINRELANINTKLQETARYPRISANAGLSWSPNFTAGNSVLRGMDVTIDPNVSNTFNGFINLTGSYNLYNGGVTKRNIENAQMQELIAQLGVEDLKRNLSSQMSVTLANYENQKRLLLLTEDLLANAKKNLDIADERFKAAQISSFDYRSIQLSYINASQARLNAYFNMKITETDIIQLIGGLVR